MTYILPIPLPAGLGLDPANDFGYGARWVAFGPDGTALVTAQLFARLAGDAYLSALVAIDLTPAFSIARVTPLVDLTRDLERLNGDTVMNNAITAPAITRANEVAFSTEKCRTIVMNRALDTRLATHDPLAVRDRAGAAHLVAIAGDRFVVGIPNTLATSEPARSLADGFPRVTAIGRIYPFNSALREEAARDPEIGTSIGARIAFWGYGKIAGAPVALAADRIVAALLVLNPKKADHGEFRYVLVDGTRLDRGVASIVATLPLGEADSPYRPPGGHVVASPALDGFAFRSDVAFHLFDRDGARTVRVPVDDAIAPCRLIGAAPGGELAMTHAKHGTIVVTDPVVGPADLAPALAAAAAAYKSEHARLKKALTWANHHWVGFEATSVPSQAAAPKLKKPAKAKPAPPPPVVDPAIGLGAAANDPEHALALVPDAETCAVYADWLVEKQDPLGEYVALRYAVTKDPESAERIARVHRANALLASHGTAWRARWEAGGNPVTGDLCGLPCEARIATPQTAASLAALDAAFATLPIDKLRVADLGAKDIAKLAGLAALRRVTALAISGGAKHKLGKATAAWLAQQALAQVRDLYGYRVDLAAAEAIAVLDSLPAVREIEWARCGLTADAVAEILASPGAARLERVLLGGNPLGSSWLAALAHLPALRGLRLADTDLGDDVADARLPDLPSVTRLEVFDNARLGEAGLGELLRAMPNVTDLAVGQIAPAGIEALHAIAPRLAATSLGFSDVAVVRRFVDTVLPRAERLRDVVIHHGRGMARAILAHPSLRSATVHDINDAIQLREAARVPLAPFVALDLEGELDDANIVALVDSGRLAHLRTVRLSSRWLTDAALEALLALPALERIVLDQATIKSAAALTRHAPRTTLQLPRVQIARKVAGAVAAHWGGLLLG